MTAPERVELSVVMPVYNEAALIESVLSDWLSTLDGSGSSYELLVYDDGSRDETAGVLARMASSHPHLRVSRHQNRGHGPTIMRGYEEAHGEWIFQTDGDGEIAAGDFLKLWAGRDDRDVVLGIRKGRQSPLHRRIISAGARGVARIVFGSKVEDANVPFRLMRASWLKKQLPLIGSSTTVPNVILSGLASRSGARLAEVPVTHIGRRSGASKLRLGSAISYSTRAVWQTIGVAVRRRSR
jgi:dolichol-phosphate mannosyltransferase